MFTVAFEAGGVLSQGQCLGFEASAADIAPNHIAKQGTEIERHQRFGRNGESSGMSDPHSPRLRLRRGACGGVVHGANSGKWRPALWRCLTARAQAAGAIPA